MGGVAGDLVILIFESCPWDWLEGLATDLVTKTLRRNDGDFIAYALVGFEVEGEFGIIAFNDDLGRFLNCLCADATLCIKQTVRNLLILSRKD